MPVANSRPARPFAAVVLARTGYRTPASASTDRPSTSTFVRDLARRMVGPLMPPSRTSTFVPPPSTVTGTPFSRASRAAATHSSTPFGSKRACARPPGPHAGAAVLAGLADGGHQLVDALRL